MKTERNNIANLKEFIRFSQKLIKHFFTLKITNRSKMINPPSVSDYFLHGMISISSVSQYCSPFCLFPF